MNQSRNNDIITRISEQLSVDFFLGNILPYVFIKIVLFLLDELNVLLDDKKLSITLSLYRFKYEFGVTLRHIQDVPLFKSSHTV